jgi:demethylmenaquinone methyltransferase/2-methoxy-6-polyprenyl-1,4-benzoquinol methylase
MKEIKPYDNTTPKKQQVYKMFNAISNKYDIANTVLSLSIHNYWKKKCVSVLKEHHPKKILDLATGTADIAIQLAHLKPNQIIAADYADNMLLIAQRKINNKKLNHLITVQKEDGENLSFEDETFDAITISFGIRNFENYQKGIAEMYRVLKSKGILLILEFSMPKNPIFKYIYKFYFKNILPLMAWIITGDKKAYEYLYDSVAAFPQYDNFCNILQQQGFSQCRYIPLTGGIATIYLAQK